MLIALTCLLAITCLFCWRNFIHGVAEIWRRIIYYDVRKIQLLST